MMWTLAISEKEGAQVGQTSDPSRTDQRIPVAGITSGRVLIRLGRGRVELGRSSGSAAAESVRVRTTATGTGGIASHSLRMRRGELRIKAPHGRLQIDLPAGPAGELVVVVKVRRGEITSWGAGGDLELRSRKGRVTCRELVARRVRVRASWVSLHFSQEPQHVEIDAGRVTVSVPAGDYAVTAPPAAEVTVIRQPAAERQIIVRGAAVRILAGQSPLSLTDEGGCGG
jgi:hypothetical protein